ncbi:glycosyltransferase family A protein [Polynucleobacter sp.]|uniref:glycosyltransferase family 2 protein n=1 Tax=Polynucleobacter sp. TaxID=2029855 RepID=UPI0025F37006|nr:glycosyltransferase family A protein [Polynucleobacter sp.]
MLLSIVIPVFNGAPFLEAAVESIYAQSYLPESFEIILVDDGSTDSSWDICQQLKASYDEIVLLQNSTNLGVAAARNLGIKRSRGEFLAMLDQDDTWLPEKLERQFAAFKLDTELELVLGMQEFNLVGADKFPKWFKPSWADEPQPGYVFGCMLTRKSTFLKLGLLDEGLKYGSDDVDWFGRAKSMGIKEALLPEVSLSRKIHGSNASSQTQPFNAELLMVIRRKIASK